MNMNIYDINYSITRYYVDEFYFSHVENLKPGSKVLDLGGNKINKRGRFDIGRYPLRVTYANLVIAKRPDIQCDAACIPFRGDVFDAVICSELLEHVPEPSLVLQEVFRVIKPGGCLLVTVPFLYRIHGDPYDYNRYTDSYWLSLLKKIGFSNLLIEKQGSFFTVIVDFLKQYASQYASERDVFSRLVYRLCPWLQRWAFAKERNLNHERWPEFIRSFTIGYGFLANK
jgi:SAM-dependent methyltransferase